VCLVVVSISTVIPQKANLVMVFVTSLRSGEAFTLFKEGQQDGGRSGCCYDLTDMKMSHILFVAHVLAKKSLYS
jgi:hypothetical protein